MTKICLRWFGVSVFGFQVVQLKVLQTLMWLEEMDRRTQEEKERRQRQKMTHQNKPRERLLLRRDSQFWEDLRTSLFKRYSDLLMVQMGQGSSVPLSINPVFFCSQVHRVLPQWLAQPDMIHRDIKSNLVPISDIPGLSAQLVNKLQNNGIQHFFPGNDRL